MAASTAVITILKETAKYISLSVIGTGAETDATLIDASTLSDATASVPNILSVIEIAWVVQDSNTVNLIWDGSPNKVAFKMARNGNFLLQQDHNVKLLNTAAGATGDVLITSLNGNYSFIITLQKESGFDSDSWY